MTTIAEHYAHVLAPIYPWMAGGVAHALREGAADVAPLLPGRGVAVRGDDDGILTCVIEPVGDRMLVQDLYHERYGETWRLTSGSYVKLRLDPALVRGALEQAGVKTVIEPGPRGMVQLSGVKSLRRSGTTLARTTFLRRRRSGRVLTMNSMEAR
ncbi:MAG TPA: hypothetical protein VG916_13020 [Gemmatimonadaceae bacterium]|nr:hypothetical protein [Gemmatimonadaceae bacterium]